MSDQDSMNPPPPPAAPPPPPSSTPPPPPTGGGYSGGGGGASPSNPLPWENRQQLGFVPALIETIKLFALNPQEAWARTSEKGDYVGPMIYGVILTTVSLIVQSLWRAMGLDLSNMTSGGAGGLGFFATVIVAPFLSALVLVIAAGIMHLAVMIVGGLASSNAGFEGTFRVAAYSMTAQLAGIIPFIGGLIAAGWSIFLAANGYMALHKTEPTKAWIAAVLPIALCCLCMIVAALAGGGALLAGLGLAGAAAN